MDRYEIVPDQQHSLVQHGEDMPVRMKQLGKAVAVSLAALAAEAGIAWLRRKIDQINQPAPAASQVVPMVYQQHPVTPGSHHAHAQQALVPTMVPARNPGLVTIWSQRIVETWEQGGLTRQTVERNVWRREEGS
jgi:hypothetical protein